ncbi:MAG: cytochrome c, partial [Blastocatellia bacterium]|nr:cytochrome c [Blastocatellia bacterium]
MSKYVSGLTTVVGVRRLTRLALTSAVLIVFAIHTTIFSQAIKQRSHNVENGERIYKSGCITCHGGDGRGAPQTLTEFERPDTFPDFTRCDQTTPESNSAWKAMIVNGGPSRGFSEIMPAFGKLLTSDEIDDVIAYLRTFCHNNHWARGELNLPRALVTEKAFPEDEVVISSAVNARGAPGVTTDVIHEQRFGMHNQIEVDVPLQFQDQAHTWYGGVGDITLGLKREMWSSLRTGSILSLFGGVIVPSGNRSRGFGTGTTTFETYTAFDQLFPTNTFVQAQVGAELPRRTDIAPQTVYWRTALGQSIAADHGLGRLWSPMVEFVADRDLVTGAKTNWDIVPQMQVTLSRRQHIRANLGYRRPLTNTAGRQSQVVFYLLWDWADGKL